MDEMPAIKFGICLNNYRMVDVSNLGSDLLLFGQAGEHKDR